MKPLDPSVCVGEVWHQRNHPAVNEFTYPMTQIWIDPDRPEKVFDHHWMWTTKRFGPIRFSRKDYLDGSDKSIGDSVRKLITENTSVVADGQIRMLTQPRMWGWLFNPITIYLLWNKDEELVAALLEVTNTPWKERHFYALELKKQANDWVATTKKELHVSPFLDQDYNYEFRLKNRDQTTTIVVDVLENIHQPNAQATKILQTRLSVQHLHPSASNLRKVSYTNMFPTHRTSLGIHRQAVRLWRKKVPFVQHPSKSQPGKKA